MSDIQPPQDEHENPIQQPLRQNVATEPLMKKLEEIQAAVTAVNGKVDRMDKAMHEINCQLAELKQQHGQPLPVATIVDSSDNSDRSLLAETTPKACGGADIYNRPLTESTNEPNSDRIDAGFSAQPPERTDAALRAEAADTVGPMHTIVVVKYEEITIAQSIGFGRFCEVFRGHHRLYGDIVFKQLLGSAVRQPDSKIAQMVKHEVEAHILHHVNIVRPLAMVTEDGHYGIVLEYVKFGNLDEFVRKYDKVGWFVLMSFARDVACGLEQLHSLKTPAVHGDMKVRNVLVGHDFIAKISDFGMSKWKESTTTIVTSSSSSSTTTHFPPERWLNINAPRTTKCDVYGYAILLWQLFSRCTPFEELAGDDTKIKDAVTTGVRPLIDVVRGKKEAFMPDTMFGLTTRYITQCWKSDPTARPKIKDVYEAFETFLRANVDNVAREKKELEDATLLNASD